MNDDELTQRTGLTAPERRTRALIATHASWATTIDRTARTAKARQAFQQKFEREVDPEGVLLPAERAKRAENARQAYYARLALQSAKARRLRREQRDGGAR